MQGESAEQIRAWVDYFRDLGVHDFYRRGDPEPAIAAEDGVLAALEAGAVAAEAIDPVAAGVAAPVKTVHSITPDAAEESDDVYPENAAPESLRAPATASPPMKLVSFNDLAPLPVGPVPAAEQDAALRAIQEDIGDCTRCPLAYAGRHKIVFGDGAASARLMFVGEGPGADEDAQGIPFVGKAGQLLNNMIAAMGLKREDVYIANIVKCRPPGNRTPEPVEANTCSQFLLRQIDVVQPQVIVALGATAATYLLGVKRSLSALRGGWYTCRGAKLAVTYHPAFLLRDPRQKVEAWKDLQMVMAELGLKPPAKNG